MGQRKLKANLSNAKERKEAIVILYDYLISNYLLTPFTHITGFTKLLQNPKIADNKKLRERYLKIVHTESKKLYRNIKIIMSLTQFHDLKYLEKVDKKHQLSTKKDLEMIMKKGTYIYFKKYGIHKIYKRRG